MAELIDLIDLDGVARATGWSVATCQRFRTNLIRLLVAHARHDHVVMPRPGLVLALVDSDEERGPMVSGDEIASDLASGLRLSQARVGAALELVWDAVEASPEPASQLLFRQYRESRLQKWLADNPEALRPHVGGTVRFFKRELTVQPCKGFGRGRIDLVFTRDSRSAPGWLLVELKGGAAGPEAVLQIQRYVQQFEDGAWAGAERYSHRPVEGLIVANGAKRGLRPAIAKAPGITYLNTADLLDLEILKDPHLIEKADRMPPDLRTVGKLSPVRRKSDRSLDAARRRRRRPNT